MAEASSTKGGGMPPAGEPGETEVAELLQTNRELQATAVELQAQNEALLHARQALDVERQRYQDLFDFAPDGYLVTDQEGVIQEANCAAAELLRVERGEVVGERLVTFVHLADRALLREQMSVVTSGAEPAASAEMRLQPRQGAGFEAALNVAATKGQGQPARLRWLIRDVSERKRVEGEQERLLAEVEKQRDTVETLAHALAR
ncbi:MAG TPA: PAS domain S-box protein, partial [Anaerolineae bacterium]|nr:PAS domain S-box protein [Anaerolineae bacterium]